MKEGVGRNGGSCSTEPKSLSAPSASPSALLSSSRSHLFWSSHSDSSLPASSSVGTSLPTSIAETKSYTASAPLVGKHSADSETVFPPPALLPHLCPQYLLQALPLRTHLEEVGLLLLLASATPALSGGSVRRLLEMLPSKAVPYLHPVEP